MNPRVRVALTACGVALVVVVVLYQMYAVVLSPLMEWRQERADDRIAYQKLTGLSARADVETALSGWKAERLDGIHYCALILKQRTDSCKAANHEVSYQRQRTIKREAPLTPLQIIVVYDRSERVIAASTLD